MVKSTYFYQQLFLLEKWCSQNCADVKRRHTHCSLLCLKRCLVPAVVFPLASGILGGRGEGGGAAIWSPLAGCQHNMWVVLTPCYHPKPSADELVFLTERGELILKVYKCDVGFVWRLLILLEFSSPHPCLSFSHRRSLCLTYVNNRLPFNDETYCAG